MRFHPLKSYNSKFSLPNNSVPEGEKQIAFSRLFVLFFLLATTFIPAVSQTMQISLFDDKAIDSYTFSIRQGRYLLECDGETYGEYRKSSILYISRQGEKIEVRDKNTLIGVFSKLTLLSAEKDGIFTLKGVLPATDSREYDDGLKLFVNGSRLKAINTVDLEKYIAGVIEAEGGITAPIEYYKAQAVLVRTYTIKNIYKHGEDGFNLCDQVHCQAYNGRSARNPEILLATTTTAGQVLIDNDSILVMSPFHSSCGGKTSSAGIYWQSDLPYLQSINDPFCREQRNAEWEKAITLTEWNLYLKVNGIVDVDKYSVYQSLDRKKFFIDQKISFRQIRERFALKSSYFSIEKRGEEIVFKGKGFGHGIGMCQLGAMEMARVGYTYLDIIHLYFQRVNLTDYREMELHRY